LRQQDPVLSEFDLIARYFTHRARHTVLAVGDDAALVRLRRGMELAVSTDMLVAGRHFTHDADPRWLGHKSLAVNLSDLAAMGATPRWATLSLALPQADPRWLRAFSAGFMQLARAHDVDLIGGDTTRGPLNVCVQIMGEVPAGTALRRDGARAGDDVWVSGEVGDAALALAARAGRIRIGPRELARIARRLHRPAPRLALGQALRGLARAAIDISDGLVADLGHICERSRVAATVELARLPASAVMRRHLDHPAATAARLAGGDDYELCFTASPRQRVPIARLGARLGLGLTRVGRIDRARPGGTRVTVIDTSGRPLRLAARGFDHFG
jgi:thiamine-monophosphate kinase